MATIQELRDLAIKFNTMTVLDTANTYKFRKEAVNVLQLDDDEDWIVK